MGFDQPKTLGKNQTGGRIALPIWIEYMGKVLKNVPEAPRTVPQGIVAARSDADPSQPPDARGATEYFYREFAPLRDEAAPPAVPIPR